MCAAVSEHQDLEFLCPSCPRVPELGQLVQLCAVRCQSIVGETRGDNLLQDRAVLFVKNSFTHVPELLNLAHRAERCRQAIQQDPDLFPKLETDIQAKLDQQDQQERGKL